MDDGAVLRAGTLLARAQRAGAVRDDIGTPELVALLKGLLGGIRAVEGGEPDPGLSDRLFAVLADGLRRPS